MSAANRLRRLISRQGLIIAAVLGLVGIAAIAGAAWVVSNPSVETVSEQTGTQRLSTGVSTSATVTGNSTIYERGQRLEDMPVYFMTATPILSITVQTSTPDGVETEVTQELQILKQASRDGQPFYRANRTLIQQTERVSGETTATTEINVSVLRQETSRIQEEIGSVGTYQVRFALTVRYQTDRYEGTMAATTPIVMTGGAYWFSGPLAASQSHSRTVTREVVRPADPATYGTLAVLGVLCLAGAFALYRYREEIDTDALDVEFYHEEYDEWISEGEFPTGTDKRYISINTLEDLVDIAIDSNKRVIFDPSLDVYSVVDGDLVYYFSKDPFNIDVWLDT